MIRNSLLRTVSAVALTLGLSTGTVGAADLAVAPVYTAPPAEAAWSWTGFYFGGHFGGGAALIDGRFNPSESPGDPWSSDWGLVVGAQAGYNWQTDSFVWGIEADVSATGFNATACNSCVNGSERAEAEIDMLGSLRLRLGMPMDRSLIYVTGGLAVRTGSWMTRGSGSGLDGGDSDLDAIGGVIGAGWEYRANEHFSGRVEALWYFFDDKNAPPDSCSCSNSTGTDFESNPLVFRIGGSYHFN